MLFRSIKICTSLSSEVGLTTISRWRDRHVGRFEDLLIDVVVELMKNKYIDSSIGWAFVPFLDEYEIPELIISCLKFESNSLVKNNLLNQCVNLLSLFKISPNIWAKLKLASDEYSVNNEKLNQMCLFYPVVEQETDTNPITTQNNVKFKIEESEILEFFKGLNLIKTNDIYKAYDLFRSHKNSFYNSKLFWKMLFNNICEENILDFLDSFMDVEIFNLNIIIDAFSCFPDF